jgi:hypothetical protein
MRCRAGRAAAQGRIASYYFGDEPLGPPRVWLRDMNIPGLCMTRSFGDAIAASVGVIDTPEVVTYALQPEDRCRQHWNKGKGSLACLEPAPCAPRVRRVPPTFPHPPHLGRPPATLCS